MAGRLPPIRGFIENTLIDWEGKIACEVFLPGCNLRCPFCHAGHLLTNSGELESIPIEAVTNCLDRHKGWIDGVVISGGEPTIHPGLDLLMEELRAHGAMIKLDTNGTRPDVIENLLGRELLDAVSTDIKTALDERYREATRTDCDVEAVRRSTRIIIAAGIEYEFRTTVCPAFIGIDELRAIADAIRGAKKFVLQQFKPGECPDPAMNAVKPYPRETLREWAAELRPSFGQCLVRGDWGAQTAPAQSNQ